MITDRLSWCSRAIRWTPVSLLLLAGCSIGPRYHAPPAPTVDRYTAHAQPLQTTVPGGVAGQAQHFVYGLAPQAQWWRAFHSIVLNQLVRRALRGNPGLAADSARLAEARAVVAADEGVFYPQVNGSLSAIRQKPGATLFGPSNPYTTYAGGLSVSYYPDVFGINKLVYNSAQAQADTARDQWRAAQLTLVGNVVTTAIQVASDRAQLVATRAIVRSEKRLLHLTRLQYQAGAVPYLSVVNQQTQLATSQANSPVLAQQLAVARYALAVLLGEFPAQMPALHLQISGFHLPLTLPVSLPSVLVKRRPDIRAAMQQLRYADAQIGIADAQFYPTVEITAAFGQTSLTPDSFFNPASNMWNVAGSLLAPIFHGGTLRAQRQEAIALYAELLADYRQTVLGAFQQVAGSLRALTHDAQALQDERRAYHAAREALRLAKESYRAGAIDSLSLLTTEAQYNQARIAYVRAQSQRYADTAALFTALGGTIPPSASVTSHASTASVVSSQRTSQ